MNKLFIKVIIILISLLALTFLFKLGGFLNEWINYSDFTYTKLDNFYKSKSNQVKAKSLFQSDWDRVCFLISHERKDLTKILKRNLSISEYLVWEFKADFVDFDHDGGLFIFEKSNSMIKIEFPGIFFSQNDQGCYDYNNLIIKKKNNGNLTLTNQ